MNERSEIEKIMGAPLTVVVGGVAKAVKPLTIKQSRAWVSDSLVGQIVALWGGVSDIEAWEDAVNQLAGATDAMLACVVDYDLAGTLGGREWLEDHASPGEIYEALKVLAKSAFPFAPDATRYVPSLVSMVMAEVAKAKKASEPAVSTAPLSTAGAASPASSTKP